MKSPSAPPLFISLQDLFSPFEVSHQTVELHFCILLTFFAPDKNLHYKAVPNKSSLALKKARLL